MLVCSPVKVHEQHYPIATLWFPGVARASVIDPQPSRHALQSLLFRSIHSCSKTVDPEFESRNAKIFHILLYPIAHFSSNDKETFWRDFAICRTEFFIL